MATPASNARARRFSRWTFEGFFVAGAVPGLTLLFLAIMFGLALSPSWVPVIVFAAFEVLFVSLAILACFERNGQGS